MSRPGAGNGKDGESMRRAGKWILLLALAFLLAGCSTWKRDTYVSVKPHAEGYAQTDPEDTEVASSYPELLELLEYLVQNYAGQATVDVSQYGEDLEADLERIVREVKRTDPLAAYAVGDIGLELAEVGARRVVSVTIDYCRTQEQLQEIQSAWGVNGVKNKVIQALEAAEPAITLRVTGYEPINLAVQVRTYYEEHLDTVMECPQVTVQVYPDSGNVRVMEIQFQYSTNQEALLRMKRDVQVMLDSAAGYVGGQTSERVKAERLYSFLRPLFVQAGPSATPVYSLLCVGVGDSQSMAMVYALLCRQAGLDCQVVSGSSNGREWHWNILCLDGVYYHADILADWEGGELTLRCDEEMTNYIWNTGMYPACPPPEESEKGTEPSWESSLPTEEPTEAAPEPTEEEPTRSTTEPEEPGPTAPEDGS